MSPTTEIPTAGQWIAHQGINCWFVVRLRPDDGFLVQQYAMGRGNRRRFATEASAKAFAEKLNGAKK